MTGKTRTLFGLNEVVTLPLEQGSRLVHTEEVQRIHSRVHNGKISPEETGGLDCLGKERRTGVHYVMTKVICEWS